MDCSLPASAAAGRSNIVKEFYVMKKNLGFRLFLRVFAALLALCLLPAAALCTGAEVEDIDLNNMSSYTLPIDFSPGIAPKAEGFSQSKDENGNTVRVYEDSTIKVTVTEMKYYGPEGKWGYTDIWYADIVISDASQLRTASIGKAGKMDFSKPNDQDSFDKGFERTNAVVAMNGDSWSASEKQKHGIVLRQGTLIDAYSNLDSTGKWRMDLLLIDEEGNFHGIHAAQKGDLDDPYTYNGKKIVNIFSFGPILVEDGKAVTDYQGTDRERSQKGTWLKMRTEEFSQRAVLCQMGPLHYRIYTCAGHRSGNRGLTLPEFGEFIASQGAQFAYNMDGGESSVLYFSGYGKVNMRNTGVRDLWDLIYFASAEP